MIYVFIILYIYIHVLFYNKMYTLLNIIVMLHYILVHHQGECNINREGLAVISIGRV